MRRTSPTVYVGLLLLLCPGVAPFQLRTPGVCSARQPTFLSEPPNLMCAADAGASSAPLLTALGDARTILTCAKCKAAFPIDADAFGSGRRVRCNNGDCNHEWYQTADRLQRLPENMELIEYPEKMRQRMREGKPAEAQTNFRVFVGNLPFVASEQELEDLFAEYGCVTGVSIARVSNPNPNPNPNPRPSSSPSPNPNSDPNPNPHPDPNPNPNPNPNSEPNPNPDPDPNPNLNQDDEGRARGFGFVNMQAPD